MVSLHATDRYKTNHYIGIQDGGNLIGFQMVGLLSNQIAFEYQTIQHPTYFQLSKSKHVRFSEPTVPGGEAIKLDPATGSSDDCLG